MEKGSIVYVEYDAYADGKIFDTTHEDVAKENDIYNEKQKYRPIPVIVGSGRLVKGFDNALLEANIGEEKEVEFGDDQGFGKRDPKLVETFSIREFRRERIEPQQGMEISIRNRRGTVVTATAGRVIVDFNDPLAGKKLRYKFRITEKLEELERKAQAIIELYYPSYEGFKVSQQEDFINVVLPEICKSDQRWLLVKFAVVGDLKDYAGINKARFIEEYVSEEKKAEEKPTEEQPAEQPPVETKAEESGTEPVEKGTQETKEKKTDEKVGGESKPEEKKTEE
jgi:FKBP-type peptidyl-prolyl cis-trans isomerase 2